MTTKFTYLVFGILFFAMAFDTSQAAIVSSDAAYTQTMRSKGSLKPEQCKGKCTYRCLATSHKKPCHFYCNYCCERCLCVPSGTYGNKAECPCYNSMKTKEGRPKCP